MESSDQEGGSNDDPVLHVTNQLASRDCKPKRGRGDSWNAHCPAHADRNPSLSVGPGSTQPVILKCGGGCETEAVLAALGLAMQDILLPKTRETVTATWDYTDESGSTLFRVEKFAGKRFRQSRPDGIGGWVPDAAGVRRVLYRLPEILAAVAAGETVYVTEGEKDADRLVQEGVVATTGSMGAGKWRGEYSDVLASAEVVVITDCDKPGYMHALAVQRSLREVDAWVSVVAPAAGKDAFDHFEAGFGLDEFVTLSVHDLNDRLAALEPSRRVSGDGARSSWWPRDLAGVLDGTLRHEPPAILAMLDGRYLFYPGKLHSLNGESESGKTWLALLACAQEIALGHDVAYIDFEDDEISAVERLRSLGVDKKAIEAHVLYVRPDEPLNDTDRDALISEFVDREVTLIVLDGMTEGLVLHGLSMLNNDDIAEYHRKLSRPFLDETRAAVVHIDHVVKDKSSRGRYAIGAAHKLAAVDVAYTLESITEFARGRSGSSKLLVMKDRPGHVKGLANGKVVGYVSVEALAHDDVTNLDPVIVTITVTDPDAQRPVVAASDTSVVKQRLSEFLRRVGKASQRQIMQEVTGASTTLKAALDEMTDDGEITRTKRQGHGGGYEYQLAPPAAQLNPTNVTDDAQAA